MNMMCEMVQQTNIKTKVRQAENTVEEKLFLSSVTITRAAAAARSVGGRVTYGQKQVRHDLWSRAALQLS